MAKDPAFLFYPGDFTTGTQFFTDEQVGKYVRLLLAQHQHGRLTKKQFDHFLPDEVVIAKFKIDDHGKYYNERLEKESEKRKNFAESRKKNRLSGDNEATRVYLMINHMNNHIKIGSSNKPERRLLEIRTQLHNEKINLLAYTDFTSQKVESDLQKKYKSFCKGFEWFSLPDEIIAQIVSEHHMIYHMENKNEDININTVQTNKPKNGNPKDFKVRREESFFERAKRNAEEADRDRKKDNNGKAS